MLRPGQTKNSVMSAEQERAVEAAAVKIGIDLRREPYLRWIAEYATSPELPEDWAEFRDDHGELAYYNPKTKVLSRTHPVLDKFGEFVTQQRGFMEGTAAGAAAAGAGGGGSPDKGKVGGPFGNQSNIQRHSGNAGMFLSDNALAEKIGIIVNEIMNRYHKDLPPVTPELVESMALYFGIPSETEWYLTKQLRFALEGFVECQYENVKVTKTPIDPRIFLNNMRREIVKKCVLEKEDPLVMCSEFPEKSAKMKIQELKDFFSQEAYTELGLKRKKYTIIPVEQDVCDVCDKVRAELCSMETGTKMCDNCYAKKRNDFIGHRIKRIKGLPCGNCNDTFAQDINNPQESSYDDPEEAQKFTIVKKRFSSGQYEKAEIYCEDCTELFCNECFIEMHRKGKRLHHVYMRINDEGQLVRAGEVLPPEESQALLDKAIKAAEGGVWLPFRDDQFNTYWYHLRDKMITSVNPYL